MTQFGLACQIFAELLVYITSNFAVEIVCMHLRLVCGNKADVDNFIVSFLGISLVNRAVGGGGDY
jgi:hypothetical protein